MALCQNVPYSQGVAVSICMGGTIVVYNTLPDHLRLVVQWCT